MRILYVLPTLLPGGAERMGIELMRRLPDAGIHPTLFAFRAAGGLLSEARSTGVRIVDGRAGTTLTFDHRAVAVLAAEARRHDLVVSGLHLSTTLACWESASFARRPLVAHVHGIIPHSLADAQRSRPLPSPVRAAMLAAYRHVYRRLSTVVCVSTFAADGARWIGARPSALHVVPNGIDVPALRASARSTVPTFLPAGRYLLGIGRLQPVKRFDRLVSLLPELPDDVHLVILGDGPLRPELRSLAERLGVGHRLTLPGHRPPAPWIRGAEAVVLTSSSESFSLVAMEALALGTPVLADRHLRGVWEATEGRGLVPIDAECPKAAARVVRRRLLIPGGALHHAAHEATGWVEEHRSASAMTAACAALYRLARETSPPRVVMRERESRSREARPLYHPGL